MLQWGLDPWEEWDFVLVQLLRGSRRLSERPQSTKDGRHPYRASSEIEFCCDSLLMGNVIIFAGQVREVERLGAA